MERRWRSIYRYPRKAIGLLAALAPTLDQAITVAAGKAYVILDGTLLRIDRVGMTSGYDRAFHSGKHKCHGLNEKFLADPAGRLVRISPVLPGARHDMGAACEHGIIDALRAAAVTAIADTAYQGAGRQSGRRSGGAGSMPTPAAIGGCRATRRPSTRRTPGDAGRVSGSTRG